MPNLSVAAVALTFASAAPHAWAGHYDDEEEIPYDEAEIYFELNDTDGDLGIHALIDGEAWKKLEIETPWDREILEIWVKGRLRRQGLTEIFFESAEPGFDELSPEEFFRRFPKGKYEISGRTLEGDELESKARVTHLMPAPPANFTVNGEDARPEDGECDEENLDVLSGEVTIRWGAVTQSHPDIGWPRSSGIEIVRYQAVAESEDEDENVFTTSIDIAPDDADYYEVTFPEESFVDGTEVKFEVVTREKSHNQTGIESCPFEYSAENGG